ncbi:hypothetical protein ON010_g3569 [Phytophthora cinnamomi]|nr:hypothetical protein ON010_g3569 [Phytophthora cinnamomi]
MCAAPAEGKAAEPHGEEPQERGLAPANPDGGQPGAGGGRLPPLPRDGSQCHAPAATTAAQRPRVLVRENEAVPTVSATYAYINGLTQLKYRRMEA